MYLYCKNVCACVHVHAYVCLEGVRGGCSGTCLLSSLPWVPLRWQSRGSSGSWEPNFLCVSLGLMWKHHGGLEELEGNEGWGKLGRGGNMYLIFPYMDPEVSPRRAEQ